MSSPRLKEGGWRVKREGDSSSKLGVFFNSGGLFAQQDEDSNQGACEQDYHAVKGMGRGFSVIEQRQHADGAKS